jgi:hypothetical protein
MCSSPFNFSTNFFIDSLSLEGADVAEAATAPEKCLFTRAHLHGHISSEQGLRIFSDIYPQSQLRNFIDVIISLRYHNMFRPLQAILR